MTGRLAAPVLAAAAALACAQPGTPPGGQPDNSPPRVIEVFPAQFDTLTDLDESVVIRFDERISERLEGVRDIADAVIVSPETSPVEAVRNSRSFEIDLIRDWEPDLVYRVVVQPLYRDLFGNQRTEPVELVFSTGAPIQDAALAGFVSDRITGQALAGVRVEATRRIDSRTYVAVTDTAGFFALRYMPAGAFDLRAWFDQDRNRQLDLLELHDSVDVAFGVNDTTVVELALLPGDTTAARLARADALDSTRVRLLLDDYFPPGPIEGQARLYSLPDTTLLGSGVLLHGSRLDSLRALDAAAEAERQRAADSLRAAEADTLLLDSLAADSLALDSLGADTLARGDAEPTRAGEPTARGDREGPPLPSQELILLSPVPLLPDSTYLVVVEGLTNIRGVPGGGGSAELTGPEPPADTAATDTVPPVPPDTIPPDTIPLDTVPRGQGRR